MTILDTIVAQKRIEVANLPAGSVAANQLRKAIARRGDGVRDFIGALANPRRGDVGLIAEVKKASPSLGVICPNFDPVRIAKQYEAAGASCLSVLTDEQFFQGSLSYLKAIRAAVAVPLLRKDFIIDERQILEAIEWGADAILLIVAILTDEQLTHFHALADDAGLTALVEVHDEAELERALECGARLVGVNNRDLKTFKVDLANTERLAKILTEWQTTNATTDDSSSHVTRHTSHLLVAESGIHTRADVKRLKACGARAILVGESLMKSGDIAAKAAELLGT
jgi:indole-3-glycerol phosphate synthase